MFKVDLAVLSYAWKQERLTIHNFFEHLVYIYKIVYMIVLDLERWKVCWRLLLWKLEISQEYLF